VDKNYPAILKLNKVNKFFNNSTPLGCYSLDSFCNPDDYRSRLIFGDYQYRFNISLRGLGATPLNKSVGAPVPAHTSYGFVKRIVKVQMPASTMNIPLIYDPNLTLNETAIRINFSELYYMPAPYQIDPLNENLKINFSFEGGLTANLTNVQICTYPLVGVPGCVAEDAYENTPRMNVKIDGNDYPLPHTVVNSVTVIIEDGYFQRVGFDRFDAVDVKLKFVENVTNQSLFMYNYTTLSQLPWLEPAVVEVRVW
jgi:hypothetical protein